VRVAVFGAPGSGKSRLSVALGDRCGIPVTHLDDIFHLPGWAELDTEEFRRVVHDLCTEDRWIMDGNYGRVRDIVLARATHVIAFDLPPLVCVWRIVVRTLGRRLGWRRVTPLPAQVHADGEPFIEAVVFLTRAVMRYRRGHLARILAEVTQAGIPPAAVVMVQRPGDAGRSVDELAAATERVV
jgi:hypothetical protein